LEWLVTMGHHCSAPVGVRSTVCVALAIPIFAEWLVSFLRGNYELVSAFARFAVAGLMTVTALDSAIACRLILGQTSPRAVAWVIRNTDLAACLLALTMYAVTRGVIPLLSAWLRRLSFSQAGQPGV